MQTPAAETLLAIHDAVLNNVRCNLIHQLGTTKRHCRGKGNKETKVFFIFCFY